jgi:hypothetical protein
MKIQSDPNTMESNGHSNPSSQRHAQSHHAAIAVAIPPTEAMEAVESSKGLPPRSLMGANSASNCLSPKKSPMHLVKDGLSHIASGIGHQVYNHHVNKIIFNKPMPRQEWINGKFIQHHEKNDEAWVELFIDLIYVVLLSSVAHQLEIGRMSAVLYFKIALSFWIVCLTRQAIDEYSNRFYCHDVLQKYIYFIYTIAVFIQASAVQFDNLYQEHIDETGHAGEVNEESLANTYHHNRLFSSGFAFSVLTTRICLLFSTYD